MQTFCLGPQCIRQLRGSPMGSPLSPALCLMVVSIREQIWSLTFKQSLANRNLFIQRLRYVDNRLMFGDRRLADLPAYVLLHDGFYGKPISWKPNRTRRSWASCWNLDLLNWSAAARPTSRRFFPRFRPRHRRYFWEDFDHDITLSL